MTRNNPTNSPSSGEEKECWNKIKQGDKAGLEGLYTLFAHELVSFGLSVVHDRSLVKDCIQELFIEIWRYRRNGIEVNNVKMYVLRALANKIKKEISNQKKRQSKEQSEEHHFQYFRNEAEMGNFTIGVEDVGNQKLIRALEKLPSRQYEVIQYAFFENLSNEQISNLMGINLQSVYTLTWKAICNLKRYYLYFILFFVIS